MASSPLTAEETQRAFRTKLRSRQSLIQVPTVEESRLVKFLIKFALQNSEAGHQRVQRWSCTEGLSSFEPEARGFGTGKSEFQNAEDMLRDLRKMDREAGVLTIACDLHRYFDRPEVIRLLREIAQVQRGSKNTLILVQPTTLVPSELEGDMSVAEFPLPALDELEAIVDRAYQAVHRNDGAAPLDANLKSSIAQACSGLTETAAKDAIAEGLIEVSCFDSKLIECINIAKADSIRKMGSLSAVKVDTDINNLGGLDVFKAWVQQRKRTYEAGVQATGIRPPRGVLMLGVPGGGKSLAAQVVAHTYNLPLFQLNMGALYGGILGETESNVRKALALVETLSPCVLWIDEIDKGVEGSASSGKSDGGASTRVLADLLTWLQNRQGKVFCYFTANRLGGIPPELQRRGRIDQIFFVDLPTPVERREILAIHLTKRNRILSQFNLDLLVEVSHGFVGAEIEAAIEDAMITSLGSGAADVTTEHIVMAFRSMVPLARTREHDINEIRDWVKSGRVRSASSGEPVCLDADSPKTDSTRFVAAPAATAVPIRRPTPLFSSKQH